MSETKWYAVHTYASFENRVKESIETAVRKQKLESLVSKVVIPTEEVAEIKDGKKRVATRKIMPGYVLVEMILDEVTWALIKDTPG
ncbi:MAG: transcription termination/antitermination protein NusG, partial [Candidatus Omnitrophica bacterium]|nr:transcription termination/antitermination protein NusG [Candidatus Omnitrophota bacterium]